MVKTAIFILYIVPIFTEPYYYTISCIKVNLLNTRYCIENNYSQSAKKVFLIEFQPQKRVFKNSTIKKTNSCNFFIKIKRILSKKKRKEATMYASNLFLSKITPITGGYFCKTPQWSCSPQSSDEPSPLPDHSRCAYEKPFPPHVPAD